MRFCAFRTALLWLSNTWLRDGRGWRVREGERGTKGTGTKERGVVPGEDMGGMLLMLAKKLGTMAGAGGGERDSRSRSRLKGPDCGSIRDSPGSLATVPGPFEAVHFVGVKV